MSLADICRQRLHCATCLTDAAWRAVVGAPDVCPHGVTINTIPHPATQRGAGTELKKLLAGLGIVAFPSCQCNAMAARMDREGVEWCEANLTEIVTVMAEEAANRGWLRFAPFKELGAELLVRKAIGNAKAHSGGD